jgi:hypothetical protein
MNIHREDRSLGKWWNEFWFVPVDEVSLRQTRMGVGCAACLLFLGLLFVGPKWFGDDGWFDSTAGLFLAGAGAEESGVGVEYRWSPFYSYPILIVPIAVIGLLASAAMVIGRWGRVASLVAFVCLLFFHHRAPLLVTRSEPLLAAALFYLALVPSASKASKWSFLGTVGLRMLQVHFFVWIGFSLASMLANEGWWTGTAIHQLLVEQQGFLPRSWATPGIVEFLMHLVLASQALILVCILNPSLRPLGFWATVVLVVAIILILADWMYGIALFAVSVSIWRIPFLPTKQLVATS